MTASNEAPEIGTTDYKKRGKREKKVLTPTEKNERTAAYILVFLFYWVFACLTTYVMTEHLGVEDSTVAQRFGLFIFWPLFAVKYLVIGAWEVLTATCYLLF